MVQIEKEHYDAAVAKMDLEKNRVVHVSFFAAEQRASQVFTDCVGFTTEKFITFRLSYVTYRMI